MSRVKAVALPLISLYIRACDRIAKMILRLSFFDKIKNVINISDREKMGTVLCKRGMPYNWLEGKGLHIALGMLTVSTVLLIGVLISLKQDSWGTAIRQEQEAAKQEVATNGVAPSKVVEVVPPQPIEVVLTNKIESEEYVGPPTEFRTIKGPVKLDFGWQLHPLYKDWRYHAGIDITGLEDQAVHAVCAGEVADVMRDRNTGITVIVKNNSYMVYYGSLSRAVISKGSHVRIGQEIGKMGTCSAEPYYHVHLQIKKDDQTIDPNIVMSNQ